MDTSYALAEMLAGQLELQKRLHGGHPKDFMPEDRAAYVREMSLALTDEVHEALGEIAWKSWAKSDHFNRDAYVGELIDTWHFLMNLLLVADVSADEFVERYHEKLKKNHQRQDDGYNGISTKCPLCKRDVNDTGVGCIMPYVPDPKGPYQLQSEPGYCEQYDATY